MKQFRLIHRKKLPRNVAFERKKRWFLRDDATFPFKIWKIQ